MAKGFLGYYFFRVSEKQGVNLGRKQSRQPEDVLWGMPWEVHLLSWCFGDYFLSKHTTTSHQSSQKKPGQLYFLAFIFHLSNKYPMLTIPMSQWLLSLVFEVPNADTKGKWCEHEAKCCGLCLPTWSQQESRERQRPVSGSQRRFRPRGSEAEYK